MVCTVRKSAPFSTMCVAQEWRSMCGEAARPEATEAARTICQMRWRVSFRPPRAMNSSGEFGARGRRSGLLPCRQVRAETVTEYSVSAS
jgi:hypothetical protein